MTVLGPQLNRKTIPNFDKDHRLPDYVVVPNVLTKKECQGAIKYAERKGRYEEGKTGGGSNPRNNKQVRDTEIYWFNHKKLADKIAVKINEVNKQIWNYKISEVEFFQLGVYNSGGHYSWHKDDVEFIKGSCRKLSFTLLLNDSSMYEGGDLQMHTSFDATSGSPIVKKVNKLERTGSMVIFPSNKYHRVVPVTKGQRISLVGWCWGPRLT